jgi:hypothetical protein
MAMQTRGLLVGDLKRPTHPLPICAAVTRLDQLFKDAEAEPCRAKAVSMR